EAAIDCYRHMNGTFQTTRFTQLIWPFPFSYSLCFIVYRANETLHCRIGTAVQYNWIMWPFNLKPSSCLLLNNQSIYCIDEHQTLYNNDSKVVPPLQWSYELVLIEWPFPFSFLCRMYNNETLYCYPYQRGGLFRSIILKWPFSFISFKTCDYNNAFSLTCYIQRNPKISTKLAKLNWPFRTVAIIWPFTFSPLRCRPGQNKTLYCPILRQFQHHYAQLQWPFPFSPYHCIYRRRGMLHCYLKSNVTLVESTPLTWSFDVFELKWPFPFALRYCNNIQTDQTILCYRSSKGELFVKLEVQWNFPFPLAACVLDYTRHQLTCYMNTMSNKSITAHTGLEASKWLFRTVSVKWPFLFSPLMCNLFTKATGDEVFFYCINTHGNKTIAHYWPFEFSPYQC
ncbi:unnamed protein product, partial [Owenia fusiformis]